MSNSLQKLAAGMKIPGTENLFVQPDENDFKNWEQLDTNDDDFDPDDNWNSELSDLTDDEDDDDNDFEISDEKDDDPDFDLDEDDLDDDDDKL